MLLQCLQEIIPNLHYEFPKLTNGENPYVFVRWSEDHAGNYCMHYKFPSRDGKRINMKRVVIQEFEALLISMLEANIPVFDRPMFQQHCPITNGAGPCGNAVSLRMYQFVLEAARQGHLGEDLNNFELLQEILK